MVFLFHTFENSRYFYFINYLKNKIMANTEQAHYKCSKCGDTVSTIEYSRNNYGRSGYAECSKGGKCNWKKQQQSGSNSIIGWVFGLLWKGVKGLFSLIAKK